MYVKQNAVFWTLLSPTTRHLTVCIIVAERTAKTQSLLWFFVHWKNRRMSCENAEPHKQRNDITAEHIELRRVLVG